MTVHAGPGLRPHRDGTSPNASAPVLYAEDDPDDRLLMTLAHRASNLPRPMMIVEDGQAACDYLVEMFDRPDRRLPEIIFLDVNMPRLDGCATTRWIKSQEQLRRIPVIVLTTSVSYRHIQEAYLAGANTYIVKPSTVPDMTRLLDELGRYWFDIATLPGARRP